MGDTRHPCARDSPHNWQFLLSCVQESSLQHTRIAPFLLFCSISNRTNPPGSTSVRIKSTAAQQSLLIQTLSSRSPMTCPALIEKCSSVTAATILAIGATACQVPVTPHRARDCPGKSFSRKPSGHGGRPMHHCNPSPSCILRQVAPCSLLPLAASSVTRSRCSAAG